MMRNYLIGEDTAEVIKSWFTDRIANIQTIKNKEDEQILIIFTKNRA